MEDQNQQNPEDVVAFDVPTFIRLLEFAREDATDDEALVCAERVRMAIESLALENHDTDRGVLTASLGVVSSVAGFMCSPSFVE